MRIYSGNMRGEKYLGNKRKLEIHDLDNEKSLCLVNNIVFAKQDVPFNSLNEARKQQYKNCSYCIGNLNRQSLCLK